MTAFDYVALDGAGKRRKGSVEADNARAARKDIRDRKLTLLELTESRRAHGEKSSSKGGQLFGGGKLKDSEVVLITRQLSMLIGAGTPVEEALGAVAAQTRKASVRSILNDVRAGVTEGYRLSDALARRKGSFNALYRAVVAAGEASGDLGIVLERLAEFLERGQKMRRQVMGALAYPAVLAVVALAVTTLLMVLVVPMVVEQFADFGQELPLLTQIVIGISDTLRSFGVFIGLGVVAAAVVFGQMLRSRKVRRQVDGLVLRLPVFGRLARSVNAARFSRTMGTLVASGAPVLESLAAARATASNVVIQDAVDEVASLVREGGGVAPAMTKTQAFPALLVYIVASGERGGDLAGMFTKGAEYLESEFEAATTIALNLLEPLIIVFMGVVVGAIVMSIMLPLVQMNTLAGG